MADAVAAVERLARAPRTTAPCELILTRYRSVHRYLPLLLETTDFQATDAGEPILDALDALGDRGRQRFSTDELPSEFIPPAWRRLGPARARPHRPRCVHDVRFWRRCATACAAATSTSPQASATAIPARACSTDHAWQASRVDVCRSLSLPEAAGPFLERLGHELDAAYRRTIEALHADHPVHQLAAGRLAVEQLDALPEPDSLLTLRQQINHRLPDADLPDLLLEIATKTRVLDGFTHEHEPNARLSDLHISICAVLVAQACNVGYQPLIDESSPALREARLKYVARHYIRPETLIAANARIVDYQRPALARDTLGRRRGRLDRRAAVRGPQPRHPRRLQPPLLPPPPRCHRPDHNRRSPRRDQHRHRARHPARRAVPARRSA